jgi:hypothetical protein
MLRPIVLLSAILAFAPIKIFAKGPEKSPTAVTVVLSSTTPAVAAATVCTGSVKDSIFKFTLTRSGSGTAPANITSISFTTTAPAPAYVATDIVRFQLWYSNTINLLSNAVQVGTDITTTLGAGTHSFTGLNQAVSAGANYFWITMDVAIAANSGSKIQVSAMTTANFTGGSLTSGTTSAGGIQTFGTSPTPFTVTGGGTICSGTCTNIGLSGSDIGTNYVLYLGPSVLAGPIAGTGGPLDFGCMSAAGTYTVLATPTAGCLGFMPGSATITLTPSPTMIIGSDTTVCLGATTANFSYSGAANSPDKYDIIWTPLNAGFSNVFNASVPASPIPIAINGAGPAGTYNFTLRIKNTGTGCYTDYTYPNIIINPSLTGCATYTAPSDGAVGILASGGTILTWNAVAGATGYDVYLQSGSNPPTTLVSSNQPGTTYATGGLLPTTTYYWKVVPRNSCGGASGCSTVWSFTTGSAAACITHTTQSDFSAGINNNTRTDTLPGSVVLQTYISPGLDQEQITSGGTGYTVTNSQYIAQTFIPGISGKLTAVNVEFSSAGNGSCNLQIYNTSGGIPTTPIAGASTPLTFYGGTGFQLATFTTPPCLTAGTQYAIVCYNNVSGSIGTWNQFCVPNPTCNPYANGSTVMSTDGGSTWTTKGTDAVFQTYMSTYAYSTSGTYESPIIDAGGSADWTTFSWNASVPAGTTLNYQIWAGNNPSGPFLFVGPSGTGGTFFTVNPSSLDAGSPGPPYSFTYGKRYLKYKAYLSTTVPSGTGGCTSGSTPTINDVTVCYNVLPSCSAPTIQASNIFFSNVSASQVDVSWTIGNGQKRMVKVKRITDPAFTSPANGTDPIANSVYSGAGEQVVFNGTGNSATVTGLNPSSTYVFEVYEANCSGSNVAWLNTTATNNPGTITPYVQVCPNGTIKIGSNLSGTTYQWQESTDSITYNNISNGANYSGATTDTLTLINIPSSWYGNLYRCVVNGSYSFTFPIKITNYWTGAVDNTWENPANWSCGTVPDGYTDVFVNAGAVIVLNSNTSIGSLTLNPGASFTVNPPYTLTILGH